MKRQMDVEKAIAAAGAEVKRAEQVEKLVTPVRRYYLFLCIGSVIVAIAPRLAPASRPAFIPSVPAGYGFPVTLSLFTVATMVIQEMLARVLERRPSPAPRLAPESVCQLCIATWIFVSMFFHSYLSFGGDDYFVRSCDEWKLVWAASTLNLLIATSTRITWLEEDIAAVS